MKMELIQTTAALAGLLVNSISDIMKKEIMIKYTVIMSIFGVLLKICDGFNGGDFLLALLPGAVSIVLAFVTREQIGYGDGWVLLALGCCISSTDLVSACMIALAGIGLAALLLFVVFHKSGTYEIPFVPFLLVGTVCVRCF